VWVHGGLPGRWRDKREQRVLLAEARAATPTVIMQEPEEILLTALHDTNAAGLDGVQDLHPPAGGSTRLEAMKPALGASAQPMS
jgi:hypothetical protein